MDVRTFAFASTVALAALGVASSRALAAPLINEIDSDQVGTDSAEFVELVDAPATSLNGMVLVFYNGSTDTSYLAIDLDGFVTDSNGFFLAGNPGIPGLDAQFPTNTLQNGQDAVALYTGDATSFPNGTAVTTANLIDAVVYDTSDPDDAGLLVLLTGGSQVDEDGGVAGAAVGQSIGRIPNGSGGARDTSTYSINVPTPNSFNLAVPEPAGTMAFAATAGLLACRRRSR